MTVSDLISRLKACPDKELKYQVYLGKNISTDSETEEVWKFFDVYFDRNRKAVVLLPKDIWERKIGL